MSSYIFLGEGSMFEEDAVGNPRFLHSLTLDHIGACKTTLSL